MKKFFLIFGMMLCGVLGYAQTDMNGILFEISGNGLKKPSYLLGSFHIIAGENVHKIPSFDKIYEQVSQLCFETDMDKDPALNQETMGGSVGGGMKSQMSPTQILLPADSSYVALIGKEKAHVIDSVMTSIFPMYVSNMRPAYAKMLANAMYMMKMLGLNSQNVQQGFTAIDYYAYEQAVKDKKSIRRLEPIEVQDSILKMLNEEKKQQQVASAQTLQGEMLSLYAYCLGYAKMVQDVEKLRSLYLQGKGMEVVELLASSPSSSLSDNKQVKKRNANWIKLMPDMMKGKQTLFVVGLAHALPYKESKGILNELKEMGYQIKNIK